MPPSAIKWLIISDKSTSAAPANWDSRFRSIPCICLSWQRDTTCTICGVTSLHQGELESHTWSTPATKLSQNVLHCQVTLEVFVQESILKCTFGGTQFCYKKLATLSSMFVLLLRRQVGSELCHGSEKLRAHHYIFIVSLHIYIYIGFTMVCMKHITKLFFRNKVNQVSC